LNYAKLIQDLSIIALPILLAITLHEWGHAWAANQLGDPTARLMGRISINPIRHVDPIGTILVPIVLYMLGGLLFGWAKPVPVDPRNLRRPQTDMMLVALAGPIMNLLMAAGWALVWKASKGMLSQGNSWAGEPLLRMAGFGIYFNIILCVFNMLPIPSLDGGNVLSGLLPRQLADAFNMLAPFGLFIVVGLIYFQLLGPIINPPLQFLLQLYNQLFGLGLTAFR
jgi:Zn-dependent protease